MMHSVKLRDELLIEDINACEVPTGHGAFWWLGQHSFVVKLGRTVCYIDPFLSNLPGRQVPPLLSPGDVTNAAVVLGTHDHADHIDRGALPGILAASPEAHLIIPELVRASVADDLGLDPSRVFGIDAGRSISAGEIAVTAVPAAHELLDRDAKTGLHPYLGFVVEGNDFCVYHAGDTCLYEGMQAILRRWSIDLAMLPINGRDAKRLAQNILGNMTYQEAADLAGSIRPGLTVPAHFEMFEANREDPQLLVDYMRVKYPQLNVMIATHGDRNLVGRAKSRAGVGG